MKRINLTLLSTPLVIAPIAIVSCTWFKDDTAARIKAEVKQINQMQDYTKPNKWMDGLFTSKEEEYLKSSKYDKGNTPGFTFSPNVVTNAFEKITKTIPATEYSDAILNKQFGFTEFNDTVYIKNFLSIYSKWTGSSVLGYHQKNITEGTGTFKNKKKIWIASHGGPLGFVKDENISTEGLEWEILRHITTPITWEGIKSPTAPNNSGVDMATFNQAQFGFVPSAFINGVSADVKKILLDRIKSNKNYAEYEKLLNDGTLNNYAAMKLMLGDVDLPVSRTLESISESMIEINSIRKELLIDYYKKLKYDVILGGTSYGYEEIMEEAMINQDIIEKSFSVSIGLNFLNKALKGSRRQSGGIVTPTMESAHTLKGNGGTVDQLLFFSTQYIKQKYGVLERLRKDFKDTSYLKEFQDKVSIFLGGADFNVGVISNYESDFLKEMGITNTIKPGEGHTLNSFPGKKWFATNVFKENLYEGQNGAVRFYEKV
ncbi:MAG: hypothetical protein KAG04_00935 [Mycoplasmataceae bacterium]|nr:hypothetical protein [Mycoplasmataceae bacterium]